MSTPMRRIAPFCCARTEGGHAAAPQSRVMKSRRLMGAYPKARITEDYNRSELGRWRASQQKRSPDVRFGSEADKASSWSHVRFTPESGQTADISVCPLW